MTKLAFRQQKKKEWVEMLDIIIDEFKDDFIGKVIKNIEITGFEITLYFTDGDFIRVETESNMEAILAWTAR